METHVGRQSSNVRELKFRVYAYKDIINLVTRTLRSVRCEACRESDWERMVCANVSVNTLLVSKIKVIL